MEWFPDLSAYISLVLGPTQVLKVAVYHKLKILYIFCLTQLYTSDYVCKILLFYIVE